MEKLKLLEAKQAKDYADTDIEYRNKRIASLMLSLKDEQDAQTTTKFNTISAAIDANVPRNVERALFGDTARAKVLS